MIVNKLDRFGFVDCIYDNGVVGCFYRFVIGVDVCGWLFICWDVVDILEVVDE